MSSFMLPLASIDALIDNALSEDLHAGDLTTEYTVDADVRARAVAVAKSKLLVCGGPIFARVFERLDPLSRLVSAEPEGKVVLPGQPLWTVYGPARALLAGERTALNFVQRMSGIATLARSYVEALPEGSSVRITDTRKTTPGLRLIERYSVRVGGAHNHRNDLSSAVLIKDNHIRAAGSIGRAVARARAFAPHVCRIEVEVESFEQLDEALSAEADIILLDNFSVVELREAVQRAGGRAILEASGGITRSNIASVAATGVHVISVGALTHSAPAADIALDLELVR